MVGRVAFLWQRRKDGLWAPHRFKGHHRVHMVLKVIFLPSCLSPASLLASRLPVQHWGLPLFLTGSPSPFRSGLVPRPPASRPAVQLAFPGKTSPSTRGFLMSPWSAINPPSHFAEHLSAVIYSQAKCCWFLRAWLRGSLGSPAHSVTLLLIYNLADWHNSLLVYFSQMKVN